jgi:hypothetical protein
MRKMSKSLLILATIVSFCGCAEIEGDVLFEYGHWYVSNTTTHSFEVSVVYEGSLASKATVESGTPKTEITDRNQDEYWTYIPTYCSDEVEITFEFENGVRHTFNGTLITNDVRSAESWKVVQLSPGVREHIYSFDEVTFDAIMALYE